jgi:hypothetical protein
MGVSAVSRMAGFFRLSSEANWLRSLLQLQVMSGAAVLAASSPRGQKSWILRSYVGCDQTGGGTALANPVAGNERVCRCAPSMNLKIGERTAVKPRRTLINEAA